MSLFTAKGQEAKESATKKNLDLSKVFIRLKDGESVRVRLVDVTATTVGEYKSHSDYNKGIYTAPCIAPMGVECPYCVASNSGLEGWDTFYARKRYLIVFKDIDTQAIRVWDASKQQGEAMLKLMEEYAESIDEMAFTFKRTGAGASDTSYNLIPILKLKPEDKEKFNLVGEVEVPGDFLESVLIPRTREQMIENLKTAGFPTADFFPESQGEATEQNEEPGEEPPEEIKEDELPNF